VWGCKLAGCPTASLENDQGETDADSSRQIDNRDAGEFSHLSRIDEEGPQMFAPSSI